MIQNLIGQQLEKLGTELVTYVPITEKSINRVEVISLRFTSSSAQIENPIRIISENGEAIALESLLGKIVANVNISVGVDLTITFKNSAQIIISLLDQDYHTPEAMSYYPDRGNIVVIN